MSIELNENYSTSDLALAAVLSLTYPIEAIDKQNPQKAQFLFKRDTQFDQIVESYWRRELKIEPQAYFNQIRYLKTRLYETT